MDKWVGCWLYIVGIISAPSYFQPFNLSIFPLADVIVSRSESVFIITIIYLVAFMIFLSSPTLPVRFSNNRL